MRLGLGMGAGRMVPPRALAVRLGAIAWYRADVGVTTVAGKVSALEDQVTGVVMTQATAGNRLTYTADYGDGAPAIESAGTGWITGPSVMSLNSDFTLVGLVRHAADSYWFSQNTAAAPSTFKFAMRALTTVEAASTTNDAAATVEVVNLTSSANAWHVVIVRRSVNTLKVRVGNSADVTGTLAGTNTTNLQTIGASRSDGSLPLNGAWREIQQYQSHLSDANVALVIADIKARWPNVP